MGEWRPARDQGRARWDVRATAALDAGGVPPGGGLPLLATPEITRRPVASHRAAPAVRFGAEFQFPKYMISPLSISHTHTLSLTFHPLLSQPGSERQPILRVSPHTMELRRRPPASHRSTPRPHPRILGLSGSSFSRDARAFPHTQFHPLLSKAGSESRRCFACRTP